MNRVHHIEMLVRAADAGSFAKAAQSLGLSSSAVSRAIGELEAELRVALFHRTTRSLKLTADGEELYHRGSEVLDKLEGIETAISRTPGRLGGILRVGLSAPLSRYIIMPGLAGFMRRNPGLRLQCYVLTQPKEMHAEGVDLLLRVGTLPESGLIARKLAALRFVVCASPDYLKSAGTPKTPDDLLRHRCLIHRPPHEPRPFDLWTFEKRGVRKEVRLTPALLTNDREGLITAAVNGAGIAQRHVRYGPDSLGTPVAAAHTLCVHRQAGHLRALPQERANLAQGGGIHRIRRAGHERLRPRGADPRPQPPPQSGTRNRPLMILRVGVSGISGITTRRSGSLFFAMFFFSR